MATLLNEAIYRVHMGTVKIRKNSPYLSFISYQEQEVWEVR